MTDDTVFLIDYEGREIRLTSERRAHILEHPELADQFERIRETLESPVNVVATDADPSVIVYHRFYAVTPVTSKFLLVVVKRTANDAFVLTAFFSARQKKGLSLWQA
jgi:hypothetical protein